MNKVTLIGRLTKDPDIKYTAGSNIAVCQFTIAVDRRAKDDNQHRADFISIIAWRGTADFVCRYFKKGSKIAISGQIQSRSWDDQNGQKHYATEVIAEEVEFCESKQQTQAERPPIIAQDEAGYFDGVDEGNIPI